MSIKLIDMAMDCQIPPGPRSVLICLSEFADHSGRCWPGQARIAHRTGFTTRTIGTHSEWLAEQGYLSKWRIKDSQYHYQLHPSKWPCEEFSDASDQSTSDLKDALEKSSGGYPKSSTEAPEESSHKPSENLQIEPLGKTPAAKVSQTLGYFNAIKGVEADDTFILKQGKQVGGIYTPYGVTDVWRRLMKKYHPTEYAFVNKEDGAILGNVAKALGVMTGPALVLVLRDWIAFTHACEKKAAAFNCPLSPNVKFLMKYVQTAGTLVMESEPHHEKVQSLAKPVAMPDHVTIATKKPLGL